MDKEAERIRLSTTPTPPIPIFTSSAVAIVLNKAVVTDTLGKRIRHHITGRPLCIYLLKKNHWTNETMALIDWNILEKYMNTVPHNKATNLIKLMHGWQFTTGRQMLMQAEDDDDDTSMNGDCPLGCGCREEDHHYLVCQKKPGATQMQREKKSLKEYLTNSETHPGMTSIITRSLCAFLEGKEPSLRWRTTTPLQEMIKEAFHEQRRIVWKQTFLGHISSRWKYVQQKWYEEISSKGRKLNKHQTPQVRATNLCRQLMFFALNQWQIRNEVYHDRVSKYS